MLNVLLDTLLKTQNSEQRSAPAGLSEPNAASRPFACIFHPLLVRDCLFQALSHDVSLGKREK
jgi:hypothetical protein